jgi:hypothetical protein
VSHPHACRINYDSSTCLQPESILDIKQDLLSYQFYFAGIIANRNMIEFSVTMSAGRLLQPLTNRFALQSNLPRLIHMESSTSSVVAEYPSAIDTCPFEPWDSIRVGSSCDIVEQLGGGSGLAFFKGRFFGLRPNDGQVIDINKLSTTSYIVDEDGEVAGQKVFPAYCPEDLVNADDITVISNADEDQIYAVKGMGAQASIRLMKKTGATCSEHIVCDLGAMNWSQSYTGIAADQRSLPLVPPADLTSLAYLQAIFYLKTDSGNVITALVTSTPGVGSVTDPYVVNDAGLGRTFRCTANLDDQKQFIERSRTLGFERGSDNDQPYIIY